MIKPEVVYVKKLKMRCPHCDYKWLSESQSDKRICCVKCKTSITLAPGSSLPEFEEQKIIPRVASILRQRLQTLPLDATDDEIKQALLNEERWIAEIAEQFRARAKNRWLPKEFQEMREAVAKDLDEMVRIETQLINEGALERAPGGKKNT